MRPRIDHNGYVVATGMWVHDRAYAELVLPSVDVVYALADQEQRSPQKSAGSSALSPKLTRMPGLDAPRHNQAPEAVVRSLCASLCARGAHYDQDMSDARRRQLENHGVWVVISCLKFGAMAQVTCDCVTCNIPFPSHVQQAAGDVASMLLWASRASSLADHCLLNSDPVGICMRVWAMDFKVCL
jgi:hypothetical protein